MEKEAIKRFFVFYLLPEFTLLAFSCAVEALRLANHVLGREVYAWRLASREGQEIYASCGIRLGIESSLSAERSQLQGKLSAKMVPSMVVICAGLNVERYANRSLEAWLRECRGRKIAVAGLCSGADLLARAGLLNDKKCVIHWANFPEFAERFQNITAKTGLFEEDCDIHTCAGGMASFDMMVHIIRRDFGDDLADKVCEQAIAPRIRQAQDHQRLPFSRQLTHYHPALVKMVERMQENLSEPQPIEGLINGLGLTRRQMERHFQRELHNSPARYYMKLRLERAQLLLQQSTMSIVEVAIASGFSSASHFSKCYREFYNCSPHETRTPTLLKKMRIKSKN